MRTQLAVKTVKGNNLINKGASRMCKKVNIKQQGFTLIEMMMVVAAIGVVLAILIVPNMSSGNARQDAILMERVARSANTTYTLINRVCGTSQRIASNNIIDSSGSNGVAELLFYGNHDSSYERCYARAGVSPQSSDVDVADNEFRLTGTDMVIQFLDNNEGDASDDARSFNIEFSRVSRDVAEAAAQRFDSDAEYDSLGGDYPDGAADGRAPLFIAGSGDELTVTYRFLW